MDQNKINIPPAHQDRIDTITLKTTRSGGHCFWCNCWQNGDNVILVRTGIHTFFGPLPCTESTHGIYKQLIHSCLPLSIYICLILSVWCASITLNSTPYSLEFSTTNLQNSPQCIRMYYGHGLHRQFASLSATVTSMRGLDSALDSCLLQVTSFQNNILLWSNEFLFIISTYIMSGKLV